MARRRSFGFQNNTTGGTGYNGLIIDNNTFQVLATSNGIENVYGIWENGHNNDNNSHITITHNKFLGRTATLSTVPWSCPHKREPAHRQQHVHGRR